MGPIRILHLNQFHQQFIPFPVNFNQNPKVIKQINNLGKIKKYWICVKYHE